MSLRLHPEWTETGNVSLLQSLLQMRTNAYTHVIMQFDEDYSRFPLSYIEAGELNGDPVVLCYSVPGMPGMRSYHVQERLHELSKEMNVKDCKLFLVSREDVYPWQSCYREPVKDEIKMLTKRTPLRDMQPLGSVQ